MSGVSKWPRVAVEEFAEVATGGTPSTSVPEYWEGGTIPWLNSGELNKGIITSSENLVTAAGLKNSSARMMPKNTVLVALTGATTGVSALLRIEACANQSVTGILPSERHDPGFLLQYLRSIRSRIVSDSWGGAQKHISQGYVKELKIPLPPLAEQHRLAAVLDKADEMRAKRRAALAELDTLTQSMFLEMFGDPKSSSWAMATVADVVNAAEGGIRTGPFGSQLLHSEFSNTGVAVLGIDNAVANEFRWNERRFISESKYRQLKRYTVRPGDVLITIMGTCGRCAVVPDDIPIAINTKHLCCITLNQTKCLPLFLQAYFLQHPIARKYLNQTAKGAIMSGLNMGIIKQMPVRLPPLELQQDFTRRVTAIKALKSKHRTALAELDALFASLQHRAFRGEL